MHTRAVIKRIVIEMLRDRRTLALMFVAPLLILTLIYYLFQGVGSTTADLAVRGVDSTLTTALTSNTVILHKIVKPGNNTGPSPQTVIRDNNYAGFLEQNGNDLTLTLAGADQSKSTLILQNLQMARMTIASQAAAATIKSQAQALQATQRTLDNLIATLKTKNPGNASGGTSPSMKSTGNTPTAGTEYRVSVNYLYGNNNSTFFDTLLPILMGFVVFFFVFIISGIGLLHERTTGTLYRLLATPIKFREIINGYLVGYGIFAIVQTLAIISFAIYFFRIQIIGNVWNVLLISILIAMAALTLGLLISAFVATEFQMMQFIPTVIIPQIFFSGIVSVDSMPGWLQVVAHAMPLYWGATSMSDVIEKGAGFLQIAPHLAVLVGFIIVFFTLNLLTMRRYRHA